MIRLRLRNFLLQNQPAESMPKQFRPKRDKPMKRAVSELADFPDDRFYHEISEGISHILANATALDDAACQLCRTEHFRTSNVLRGMVVEEASKVLILIDATRCPRQKRKSTLMRFDEHLAKRIYAVAMTYPRICTFEELREFVDLIRRPRYLDGPNDFDWILPNELLAEREQEIYVDFLKDTTNPPGEYFWSIPFTTAASRHSYDAPDVLTLARAIVDAGATSPDGLAIVADTWQNFVPAEDTDRSSVHALIRQTLNELIRRGLATEDQASMQFVLSHWTFPLWSLDLSFDSDYPSMQDLRKARTKAIQRLQATAAQRDPPPTISRETVEAMDKAYETWRRETEEYDRKKFPRRQGTGPHFRCSSEFNGWFQLPSYGRLVAKFRRLESDDRVALLALANFARDRVPNWSSALNHAANIVCHVDDEYQVSLGEYWLAGLERWEADPPPFHAGSFFHH